MDVLSGREHKVCFPHFVGETYKTSTAPLGDAQRLVLVDDNGMEWTY